MSVLRFDCSVTELLLMITETYGYWDETGSGLELSSGVLLSGNAIAQDV